MNNNKKFISNKISLNRKFYLLRDNCNEFNHENDLIKQIINKRQIDDLGDFFKKSVSKYWPKIEEIPNLNETIDFIHNIKIEQKTIGIVGDYDVDGISATTLLSLVFDEIEIKYIYEIPNRFKHGYGVNVEIVKNLINRGANVILTVDNGTTAYDVIDYLKNIEIPLIIIDHHNIQNPIDVKYFVNPHVLKNDYVILCATSLVFILLVELNNKYNYKIRMKSYVDLVGLATICDVMPLIKFNRAIVNYSIEKIRSEPMGFIQRIIEKKLMDERQFGFMIGPHINAPGRLGNAELALKFIRNPESDEIFTEIILNNHNRRKIEQEITNEAMELAEKTNNQYILVYNENWHEGVIGIVAGRLKEKYLKPTLVLTKNKPYFKGSFRSLDSWHVGNFIKLAKSNNLLVHGGGHAKAGGVVIHEEKFEEFKKFLHNNVVNLDEEFDYVDGIHSLNMIQNYNKYQKFTDLLMPFGESNPIPMFFFPNCLIKYYEIIDDKDLLLFITNCTQTVKSIAVRIFNFRLTKFNELNKSNILVHLIGTIERGFFQLKDVILVD